MSQSSSIIDSTSAVVPTLRKVATSARLASPTITWRRRYFWASAWGSSRVLTIGRFSVVSRPDLLLEEVGALRELERHVHPAWAQLEVLCLTSLAAMAKGPRLLLGQAHLELRGPPGPVSGEPRSATARATTRRERDLTMRVLRRADRARAEAESGACWWVLFWDASEKAASEQPAEDAPLSASLARDPRARKKEVTAW